MAGLWHSGLGSAAPLSVPVLLLTVAKFFQAQWDRTVLLAHAAKACLPSALVAAGMLSLLLVWFYIADRRYGRRAPEAADVLSVALTAVSNHAFPITCPVCKAGGEPPCRRCSPSAQSQSSGAHMPLCTLDGDLHLLLGPEEYQDYLRKSLQHATRSSEELVGCPRDHCQGVAALLPNDRCFTCPLCSHKWCRSCKTDWHQGVTCEKNAKQHAKREKLSLKGFKAYLKRHRTIECPRCHHGLQRTEGCNRIRCACGQDVCWRCGAKLDGTTHEEVYRHFNDPTSKCFRRTFDYRI
ncbi:hypothetical protein WJX72_009279 [[Myrmecia] bisecta]|uniref:RING-type domain-containing protein n=1 Tax=[Myrmecia] bisecta TaxID=41462 RepID=A0AAW1PDC5_9CHLO